MKIIKISDFENEEITDIEVIRAVLSGEKALYEILIRRNNQKLYRVISGYLKEGNDIEDIMQNTYVKAYEKLYQFKHTAQFSTWLIRIGINEALSYLQKKKNYVNAPSNGLPTTIRKELLDNDELNPEMNIIREETKQLLEEAVNRLAPKYRVVYILREIEGMSINDIAECLDLSNSNVKVRLHRAKTALKEKLYELVVLNGAFEFGSSRCDQITNNVMAIILKK